MSETFENAAAAAVAPDSPLPESSVITFGEICRYAWAALKGHWGGAILASLVPMFIGMAANSIPFVCFVSGILLFPLTVGVMLFFLRLMRRENPKVESVFEPFRQYGRMLWGYFRVLIFILLHFLLLIIPGYIAFFRYSMTYYVMLDNPECSVREAMIASREIMYGHKWQMFGYMLLLFLIAIPITLFTLGIGMIWFAPFVQAFCARYYDMLQQKYTLKQSAMQAE